MTDWDQLDAMGNLARLNQQRAIARQQAARDAAIAAQNAEVVRLLQEQKDREDAEKARLQSLPKCPDCQSPVEIAARRCPQCRIEIATLEFSVRPYADRLTCRTAELTSALQKRCDDILGDARRHRSACVEIASGIDRAWQQRAESALTALLSALTKYRDDARSRILDLLWKVKAGKQALTAEDESGLEKFRQDFEAKQPLYMIPILEEMSQIAVSKSSGCFAAILMVVGVAVALGASFLRLSSRERPDPADAVGIAVGLGMAVAGIVLKWIDRLWWYLRGRNAAKASAELLAIREAVEKGRAECLAKAEQLNEAWRRKLNEIGATSPYSSFSACVDDAVGLRNQLATELGILRQAVIAVVEVLDASSAVGCELRTPLGNSRQAIQQLLSTRLLPDVHVRLSNTALSRIEDIQATHASFQAARVLFEAMPLVDNG